ncbi:MAG: hypothetical protein J5965_11470 [Aeriscardovia sp.]|nr:hypothetical protein [Aeriscardovia sp.]
MNKICVWRAKKASFGLQKSQEATNFLEKIWKITEKCLSLQRQEEILGYAAECGE